MLVGLSYFAAIFNLRTPSARDCGTRTECRRTTRVVTNWPAIANQAAGMPTSIPGSLAGLPEREPARRNTGEAARNGEEPPDRCPARPEQA